MSNDLRLHIPEPCTEDWSLMTNTEKGKHCDKCSKEVFDFSSLSNTELHEKFIQFELNQTEVCGQFRNDQLAAEDKPIHTLSRTKKYLISLFVTLLPWLFSSCKTGRRTSGVPIWNPNTSTGNHLQNFNALCHNGPSRTAGSIVRPHDSIIRIDSLSLNKELFCKINFKTNEYLVSDEGIATLRKFADGLKKMKDITIEIIGHADTVGTMQQNKILSEKRAEEVKNILIKEGIKVDVSRGVGYQYPVSNNTSMAGRAANRRVEIKVQQKK